MNDISPKEFHNFFKSVDIESDSENEDGQGMIKDLDNKKEDFDKNIEFINDKLNNYCKKYKLKESSYVTIIWIDNRFYDKNLTKVVKIFSKYEAIKYFDKMCDLFENFDYWIKRSEKTKYDKYMFSKDDLTTWKKFFNRLYKLLTFGNGVRRLSKVTIENFVLEE